MKKLKYLMLVLCLSFAFVLAGCGDGQFGAKAEADIGNPENYVVATAEQETAFTALLNDEEAVGVKSYRITAETSASGMTMNMNCLYNVAGENLELAMKVNVSMQGVSETVKCWIKDNYAYGEFFGQSGDAMKQMLGSNKIKETVDGEILSDLIANLDTLTLEYCVERAKGLDLSDEAISLKVETVEDVTRYEITRDGAGVKIYLIFNAGVLNSVQLEMNEESPYVGTTTAKIVIEAFDGEIEFPNLDSFVDASGLEY